jgi:2-polyprenyl-6-methoxyphenol hydroxylase-like FAD-dependent oxidoreductase
MRSSRQIIIVGAGPGGLALALALRQAGFYPVVYERAQSGREAGCGFTLWPNAMRALDALGVGAEVRRRCKPLQGIAMTVANGSELFHVDSSALCSGYEGIGWALQRKELIELLLDFLGPGHIKFGAACVGFEQSAGEVKALFDDGSTARGCALIGADGLRSAVRSHLFGERKLRFAGYTVSRGIARLRLPNAIGVTSLGQGHQFGYFPMSHDRVYWFASRNSSQAEAHSPSENKAELLENFSDWHARVRQLIESTPDSCILRNEIYDIDPLPAWTSGHVTLLGDAAHPATPDLGQGACQAIEDSAVLSRCLQRNSDIGVALKNYESHRIHRTRELTLLARRIGRSGTWTNPFLCGLRNWAIRHTPQSVRVRQLQEMFDFETQGA